MALIHKPARWSLSYTAPAQEPIPLEEFKAHARVDFPDDDAAISGFLAAARHWVEAYTQRALITRTATYKIDNFPARDDAVLELPGGKVQSVTSIAYTDTAGDPQTWTAAEYIADTTWEPGRIGVAYSYDWPSVRVWDLPITITYVAGYGDDPADVPEDLRTAIKLFAAELYEHREETIVGAAVSAVPISTRMLASRYRLQRII